MATGWTGLKYNAPKCVSAEPYGTKTHDEMYVWCAGRCSVVNGNTTRSIGFRLEGTLVLDWGASVLDTEIELDPEGNSVTLMTLCQMEYFASKLANVRKFIRANHTGFL